MEHRLEKTIYSNDTQYFFSLMGPRFDAMNDLMSNSLARRFGGKWEPIVIFSAYPGAPFEKKNFIIINERAEQIESSIHEKVIFLQEYEDLNQEFLKSPLVKKIIAGLLRKQEKVFVYPFTTAFLEPKDERIVILGPDPTIAKKYDNKIAQYQLFRDLDLPRNRASIMKTRSELEKSIHLPCYISAAYTSGGNESALIYSRDMLKNFLSRLRDINREGPFLMADIFESMVLAPNASAIVTDDGSVHTLVITDQILRGNRYLGNSYPSRAGDAHRAKITRVMDKIGKFLSTNSYRGLFGCDFLISAEGKMVVVDLNPRRQGGYVCNAFALDAVGVSLTDLELACAVDGSVTLDVSPKKLEYPHAWVHAKVKPYEPGQRCRLDQKKGDLRSIFNKPHGAYDAAFYKKGSIFIDGYVGYCVVTGDNLESVTAELNQHIEVLLARTLI